MAFNVNSFNKAKWTHRTATVPVPRLKQFFDENETPEFVVRGLDGSELAKMRDEGERMKTLAELANKFASGGVKESITAAIDAINDTDTDETYKSLYAAEYGIVEPKLDRPAVINLMRHQHETFMLIVNKILILSREGSIAGES